jgi:hypothetical protein
MLLSLFPQYSTGDLTWCISDLLNEIHLSETSKEFQYLTAEGIKLFLKVSVLAGIEYKLLAFLDSGLN